MPKVPKGMHRTNVVCINCNDDTYGMSCRPCGKSLCRACIVPLVMTSGLEEITWRCRECAASLILSGQAETF